jgi:hypothetical protein
MAMLNNVAMRRRNRMPEAEVISFESILAEAFRKAGWRVHRHPKAGDMHPDLLVEAGEWKYVVELKGASEGRRDRLIPLLSQAILQAQAYSRRIPDSAPLAVVAAKRVPESLAEHLRQFAERNVPDVAVGVIDAEGFRSFIGPGLEGLDANPPRQSNRELVSLGRLPDLFSDLNQWMLKVLVAQHLPESLISVPRQKIRNASQLAQAANVSVMSASRLVNQLAIRGFLDSGEQQLRIVRVDELLELWIMGNREAAKEIPARWIIKGGPDQLSASLKEYVSRPMHNQPRCCLGLFAAADTLGLRFVNGVSPHIYVEHITLDALNRLGLAIGNSDRPPDLHIRVPFNPESVFRPSVTRVGVPVSDVLQVWLDVSAHPARGRELAREIQQRALGPLMGKEK